MLHSNDMFKSFVNISYCLDSLSTVINENFIALWLKVAYKYVELMQHQWQMQFRIIIKWIKHIQWNEPNIWQLIVH